MPRPRHAPAPAADPDPRDAESPPRKRKRVRAESPELGRPAEPGPASAGASAQRAKKLKRLADYAHASPFPAFPRPTPADAARVHGRLAAARGRAPVQRAPRAAADPAASCGGAPEVLASLVGTILSQNTAARNAAAAQAGLDARFGRGGWARVAAADTGEVVEAIRCGGLANRKAETIQGVLRAVYARHGVYSLQHLASPPALKSVKAEDGAEDAGADSARDAAAMAELVAYDGVGPKTAACVLSFCLGRAAFAVDTHVFRLARVLGWVPPGADRVLAQAHLEQRIPGPLKYGLHVLLVEHGRACKGCKKGGVGECVLKKYVKERDAEEDEMKEEMNVKGTDMKESG